MDYLKKILDDSIRIKLLFGVSLSASRDAEEYNAAVGDLKLADPYFIASTTKLFTSALILKMRSEGKLELTDKISKHLSQEVVSKIHVYDGTDYSNQITVTNLLAHTSGIPDYFQNKQTSKKSLESQLKHGKDLGWDFQQAIDWSKNMTPQFKPSHQNKAHYSDTNYQLLGKIIENKYGNKFKDVVQKEICEKLHLSQTYLYSDTSDTHPKNIYFKTNPLNIPKAMASFGPDGGMVSTSKDLMVFLKAFIQGQLFPKAYFKEMSHWNNIFFPLQAGVGIHRFKAPWYFSPFQRLPEMIGHSGLSGAFAYYVPEQNLYLTGTVNQIHNPANSFKLMIKVLSAIMKKSGT